MSNQAEPVRIFVGAHATERLAYLVLEHSIRRHTTLPVDIRTIDNSLAPPPKDARFLPYTNFSYGRFAIPGIMGHAGRAIYMDSDMIVFRDISEIWEMPFDGAKILVEKITDRTRDSRQLTAVMVMDCAALCWDTQDIMARLGIDYDYHELMSVHPLLKDGDLQDRLPRGWNSRDDYTPETRLLHYTRIKTQPWVYPCHPLGHLWIDELKLMLKTGAISEQTVRDEVAAGHTRPSLLPELGLTGLKTRGGHTAQELLRYDQKAGYVIHRKLLADLDARRKARLEYGDKTGPRRYWRLRERILRNLYRQSIRFFTEPRLRW